MIPPRLSLLCGIGKPKRASLSERRMVLERGAATRSSATGMYSLWSVRPEYFFVKFHDVFVSNGSGIYKIKCTRVSMFDEPFQGRKQVLDDSDGIWNHDDLPIAKELVQQVAWVRDGGYRHARTDDEHVIVILE